MADAEDDGAWPWVSTPCPRDTQYRTDENLAARQSIYAYEQPGTDLPASVLSLLDLRGNEMVADVGCGNGAYLAELARRGHGGRTLGLDVSAGMLRAARSRASPAALAAADAAALPLREAACDVVLSMHMLYHVPDPRRALAEMRRVARPGGRVVIGLNGDEHLRQITEPVAEALRGLGAAALRDSGLGPDPVVREHLRLDEGESLAGEIFAEVARQEFAGELVIPGRGPIERYMRSMMVIQRTPEPDRLAARAATLVRADDDGMIRVAVRSGCLVCR